MSQTLRGTARRHPIATPAAIIGTLAGVLTGTPATAAETGAISTVDLTAVPRPMGGLALSAGQAPASYTVKQGDTVWAIAQRFGLRTKDVLAWNGLTGSSLIHPGQVLTLSAPAAAKPAAAAPTATSSTGSTHVVAKGDTVSAIARAHGTTTSAVLAANGLSASSIIYPGQRLAIPSSGDHALNAKQAENAALIIRIGRELGVSDRGIAIALATSMVESWLRNLDWGDRDSLGLFQQRPSQGWGTPEEIRHRGYAIRAFFGGESDPNGQTTRGLLDVPGWESMSFSDAAQAVQISQYPERYGQWESQAYQWLELYG
ncbi:LysM peptidoglycan-binding domain-containing protein [Microbacterium sp. NPDC055903]